LGKKKASQNCRKKWGLKKKSNRRRTSQQTIVRGKRTCLKIVMRKKGGAQTLVKSRLKRKPSLKGHIARAKGEQMKSKADFQAKGDCEKNMGNQQAGIEYKQLSAWHKKESAKEYSGMGGGKKRICLKKNEIRGEKA